MQQGRALLRAPAQLCSRACARHAAAGSRARRMRAGLPTFVFQFFLYAPAAPPRPHQAQLRAGGLPHAHPGAAAAAAAAAAHVAAAALAAQTIFSWVLGVEGEVHVPRRQRAAGALGAAAPVGRDGGRLVLQPLRSVPRRERRGAVEAPCGSGAAEGEQAVSVAAARALGGGGAEGEQGRPRLTSRLPSLFRPPMPPRTWCRPKSASLCCTCDPRSWPSPSPSARWREPDGCILVPWGALQGTRLLPHDAGACVMFVPLPTRAAPLLRVPQSFGPRGFVKLARTSRPALPSTCSRPLHARPATSVADRSSSLRHSECREAVGGTRDGAGARGPGAPAPSPAPLPPEPLAAFRSGARNHMERVTHYLGPPALQRPGSRPPPWAPPLQRQAAACIPDVGTSVKRGMHSIDDHAASATQEGLWRLVRHGCPRLRGRLNSRRRRGASALHERRMRSVSMAHKSHSMPPPSRPPAPATHLLAWPAAAAQLKDAGRAQQAQRECQRPRHRPGHPDVVRLVAQRAAAAGAGRSGSGSAAAGSGGAAHSAGGSMRSHVNLDVMVQWVNALPQRLCLQP